MTSLMVKGNDGQTNQYIVMYIRVDVVKNVLNTLHMEAYVCMFVCMQVRLWNNDFIYSVIDNTVRTLSRSIRLHP